VTAERASAALNCRCTNLEAAAIPHPTSPRDRSLFDGYAVCGFEDGCSGGFASTDQFAIGV
jgi:hypothetical protein